MLEEHRRAKEPVAEKAEPEDPFAALDELAPRRDKRAS
jgi:hypothetical protein